jgi:hypothetical protein
MKGKIFNAQEVQSIMSGNKTQFREVIKKPRHETLQDCIYKGQLKVKGFQAYFQNPKTRWLGENMPTGITVKCPYQVGQKIFCKENWAFFENDGFLPEHIQLKKDIYINNLVIAHKASFSNSEIKPEWKWKPAQHMKQEHARLFLQIKDIRVERLQSLSCADYFAETGRRPSITHMDLDCDTPDPRKDFKTYWNATHKKPEEKFEASPWVFVYQFKLIEEVVK